MRAGQSLRLALALAVSAGLLWLLLREVNLPRLTAVLAGTVWPWLIAALGALAVGYALRIRRWQAMLRHENPSILWRQCAGPLLAGFAMNNVLPFRAGDALRCVGFGRELQVSGGGVTASVLIERLLDALMLLLALGLVLWLFEIDGRRFFAEGGVVLSLLAMAMLALLLFPRLLSPVVRLLVAGLARWLPSFGGRIRREADRGLGLLEATAASTHMRKLIGWSLLVWIAEGLVFYCVARALPAVTAPMTAWLALPVATLATLLPGTPGHLGTFDFFAAEAMQTGGNAVLASTAFALLVHLSLWLPVTVAGGLWLWLRRP